MSWLSRKWRWIERQVKKSTKHVLTAVERAQEIFDQLPRPVRKAMIIELLVIIARELGPSFIANENQLWDRFKRLRSNAQNEALDILEQAAKDKA